MTYPIRQPPDGDTAWGADLRAAIAGVNDHQTRVNAIEQLPNAKGDVVTATADNTLARLGVGGNGQVLTATSAASTGLAWATPSASAAAADGRFNIKDYGAVGNGSTDDTTSIQSALNAASTAGGGIVFVPRSTGSYIFTALDIPSNVTLQGLGGTLKLKDSTTVAATSYYPILISGRTNAHLRDLTVDGNNATNLGNTVTVVSDLVTMVSCTNSSIDRCYLFNAPDSVVMFSRCVNCQVTRNILDGSTDCGFYVNDGDGTLFKECLIHGNTILNCEQGGIALKRLTQRVIVSNNLITDCGNGITLEHITGTDYSTNMTVVNNRLRHIGYNSGTPTPAGIGIDVRAGEYVNVIGNRLEDIKGFPIELQSARYCSIMGNIISSVPATATADRAGITLWDRSDKAYGSTSNTIQGNVVYTSTGAGIMLDGVSGKDSENTLVIGNHVVGAVTYGLDLTAFSNNTTLIGNSFQGTTADVRVNAASTNGYALGNRLMNGTRTGLFPPTGAIQIANYTTGGRPGATTVPIGTNVYDTTLSKPIWSNGTVWKDGAGTTV